MTNNETDEMLSLANRLLGKIEQLEKRVEALEDKFGKIEDMEEIGDEYICLLLDECPICGCENYSEVENEDDLIERKFDCGLTVREDGLRTEKCNT